MTQLYVISCVRVNFKKTVSVGWSLQIRPTYSVCRETLKLKTVKLKKKKNKKQFRYKRTKLNNSICPVVKRHVTPLQEIMWSHFSVLKWKEDLKNGLMILEEPKSRIFKLEHMPHHREERVEAQVWGNFRGP